MVPVTGKPGVTPVCIDQYEFPDIPCEYPVVYPSAKQASELCHAVGKRLCDAHEWEGACAGELLQSRGRVPVGPPAPHRDGLLQERKAGEGLGLRQGEGPLEVRHGVPQEPQVQRRRLGNLR